MESVCTCTSLLSFYITSPLQAQQNIIQIAFISIPYYLCIDDRLHYRNCYKQKQWICKKRTLRTGFSNPKTTRDMLYFLEKAARGRASAGVRNLLSGIGVGWWRWATSVCGWTSEVGSGCWLLRRRFKKRETR